MKKRALLSAIAMLVVSAIVLTSATFAWFSMGTKVTVDTINVGVEEADGLLISAKNNADWGTTVTLTQIRANAATSGALLPADGSKVLPVSSNGTSAFIAAKYNESNTLVKEAAPEGSYYQFPVYIKYSGSTACQIKLDGTTATGIKDATKGKEAYKAARICCYPESVTSPIILAPKTDDTTFRYIASTTAEKPTDITNVVKEADSNQLYFTLQPSSVTEVTVKIWLDGEDTSCTDDDAAGGSFDVAISFSKV